MLIQDLLRSALGARNLGVRHLVLVYHIALRLCSATIAISKLPEPHCRATSEPRVWSIQAPEPKQGSELRVGRFCLWSTVCTRRGTDIRGHGRVCRGAAKSHSGHKACALPTVLQLLRLARKPVAESARGNKLSRHAISPAKSDTYEGSEIVTIWSASAAWASCRAPLGQSISIRSTESSGPSPKRTVDSLAEP